MAEEIGALRAELSANAAQFAADMGKARASAESGATGMQKAFNAAAAAGNRLGKGVEYLGKTLTYGFSAGEVRKAFGDIARVIHDAATGVDDFGGLVTSEMIPDLIGADNALKGLWNTVKGFIAEEAVQGEQLRQMLLPLNEQTSVGALTMELHHLEEERANVERWAGTWTAAFDRPLAQVDADIAATKARLKDVTDPFAAAGPAPDPQKMLDQRAADARQAIIDKAAADAKAKEAADAATKAFEAQDQALVEQRTELALTDREAYIYAEVTKLGTGATKEQIDAIRAHAAALYDDRKAKEDGAGADEKAREAEAAALQAQIDKMDAARSAAKDFLSTFDADLKQGKSATEALTDAVGGLLNKLIDLAENQAIAALFGGTGTAGGGLLGGVVGGALKAVGTAFGVMHSGGTVGESYAPTRMLPAGLLSVAPEFHTGLATDEAPAILTRA